MVKCRQVIRNIPNDLFQELQATLTKALEFYPISDSVEDFGIRMITTGLIVAKKELPSLVVQPPSIILP